MNKLFLTLVALGAIVACSGDDNPGNDHKGDQDTTTPSISDPIKDFTHVDISLSADAASINIEFETNEQPFLPWVYSFSEPCDILFDPQLSTTADFSTLLPLSFRWLHENVLSSYHSHELHICFDDILSPSTTYYFRVLYTFKEHEFYSEPLSFTTLDSPPAGAVDMGTYITREDGSTYRLYWASCNLSETGFVSSPIQYGDYYAWGEIEPYYVAGHSQDNPCSSWRAEKTGYDVNSYSFYDDGDDAASRILGGKWRIPTREEWEQLFTTCSLWLDVINGEKCFCFESKFAPTDGHRLYLPIAGKREGTKLYKDYKQQENIFSVRYWSSSLGNELYAYCMIASYHDQCSIKYTERFLGLPIRPVTE